MVCASLAWSIKAWMALALPIAPSWEFKHRAQHKEWLNMSFRRFCQSVIAIPAQILRSGRRRIFRLLNFSDQTHTFLRLLDTS